MIGEQVGDYRVVTKLGAGGMGVVYGAEHVLLGRPAALKILHPSLSSDREMVERFFNEAKAASAIRHPGIVEVYTFGYHTDGTAYLAMEFLEGTSLEHRARRGKLPEEQALRITSQIAGALGAAHDKDIVHRDLKPDNVFIVDDADIPGGERIKLLDFGIAKLAGEREPTSYKTKTGSVFGTPAYMSPEQCRGADQVDHRSDLYAVGCILYRMVCSRVPFDSEASGDVIAAQLRDPPPPPRSVDPAVSTEVEGIILKLLEKRPEDRYQSARELRSAIAAVLGVSTGQTLAIGESEIENADTIMPTPTTLGGAVSVKMSNTPERTRSSRGVLWAVAASALVIAGGASIYLATTGADERATVTHDAAVAPELDAHRPAPPPRVVSTEDDCRAALARAAVLLGADDLGKESVPYVYMREYADGGDQADKLVAQCVTNFDQEAAHCMTAAKTARGIARCADDSVERECARGGTDACGTAAGLAYDRGDYDKALALATPSCEEGGRNACSLLGLMYYYGRGVEHDYGKAFQYYSRAAAMGDPPGVSIAGMMLRYGVGVEKNLDTALDLYRESCELDDRSVGCIGYGELIWSDESRRAEAREMFARACKAGHPRGCVLSAEHGASNGRKLYEKAQQLYRAQSEISPYSARRLGELVRDGKGGKADPQRARTLFEAACAENEPFACEQLGDLHASGLIRLNLKASKKAYDQACKAGLERACERVECQRMATEGNSSDPEWTRKLRACRKTGALGPQTSRGDRRNPRRNSGGSRKPPRDNVNDLLNGL